MATETRGIRNNNPGNIEFNTANKWVGQTGIESGVPCPRFAKFNTPENGIRALTKILLKYQQKGYDTVNEIVNRYAPSTENNSRAYAQHVADSLGVDINARLDMRTPRELVKLVRAIIVHENGSNPYLGDEIFDGVMEALQ